MAVGCTGRLGNTVVPTPAGDTFAMLTVRDTAPSPIRIIPTTYLILPVGTAAGNRFVNVAERVVATV